MPDPNLDSRSWLSGGEGSPATPNHVPQEMFHEGTLPPSRLFFRRLLFFFSVIFVYVLLDRTTVILQIWPDISAWYPPTGFAVALMIGIGSEVIPALLVASYLSGYVNYHQSLISAPFHLVTPLTVLGYGAASSFLRNKLGPHLVSVSEAEGGFLGCIRRCEELAASCPNVFLPRQFSNPANTLAHYGTTGPEIWSQLTSISKRPHAFVDGVGTGGTVMGVGKYLREREPSLRVHPVEPAESPTLSTGCKVGSHRIQGISDEFIPENRAT